MYAGRSIGALSAARSAPRLSLCMQCKECAHQRHAARLAQAHVLRRANDARLFNYYLFTRFGGSRVIARALPTPNDDPCARRNELHSRTLVALARRSKQHSSWHWDCAMRHFNAHTAISMARDFMKNDAFADFGFLLFICCCVCCRFGVLSNSEKT